MNTRYSHVRGFTLIEMLAATAMVAVLAGSLYASLTIAFKARSSANAAVATIRKTHMSIELIKADLQSAVLPGGNLAGAFVGTSGAENYTPDGDALSFYATASDVESSPGVGDLKRVEYVCQSDTDSRQILLIRRITTNLLAINSATTKDEVICRGICSLKLSYYDGTDWQLAWDSANTGNYLPKAVKVEVQLYGPAGDVGEQFSQIVPVPCGQDLPPAAPPGGAP